MKERKRSTTPDRRLERKLEGELEALVRRLRQRSLRPGATRRTSSRTAPPVAAPPAPAPSVATPRPPASPELDALRAQGLTGARLIHGTVMAPGASAPVRHSWIEADDRVHDPTLGEGRRVWPRELYYLVFRAAPTRAAPTRAA